ncbi:unnamed protein product, partial [Candidula unifasciata]
SVNITGPQSVNNDEIKNCIQGCIFALDEYADNVKEVLGVLHRPTLVISSLGHSSLTLEWGTRVMENVTYKVHKRLVDMDSGWHLHANTHFWVDGRIDLADLHPYVTYKFKVLALLSSLPEHILESPETVHITTLPFGAPSTAPQITSLTTPSPRVISLTWTPPPFTNGKVLSYRIYVQAVNHPQLNLTTIEVPCNATSWLLDQLQSSQKYVISLSAWNAQGEGPKSSRVTTTPNIGNLSANETPYLILATANRIVRRTILDVVQYGPQFSKTLHETADESIVIRGISLHVRRQLILATDSSGSVSLISLKDNSSNTNLYPSIFDPGAVSVDWLADRAYVASKDRIYSCPLDKDLCVVVVRGLSKPASVVKVDPINGYLYYIINGLGKGLYRIALGAISHLWTNPYSFPAVPATSPRLIVPMSDLQTHVIDFYNVRLYVINNTAKVMMAAFLDGSNMRPFHEKIVSSAFSQVSSMVFYNQTFIWTDSKKMYVEEYESRFQNYRHNELLFFTPPYTGMDVFHPSAQPMPVPSSAPDSVDAFFTRDRVVIRWLPPPLLQYQGHGAFMNWTYELQFSRSNENGDIVSAPKEYNISTLNLTVSNLSPDTMYAIKIRARSDAGNGPWSRNFIGRTLKQDGLSVLMGLAGGQIVQKDLTDGTEKNVVNFFSDATDIDWHGDIIIWVTTSGSLSVFNRTSQQKRHLVSAYKAYCAAYDWLGHKVYWSEPGQGMIRRSDINGITNEYIRQTSARDLAVDAVNGRLYWATQHSIETCRLNGDEHQDIFNLPYFSGRHVISLTLDFDSGKVLWYVKGYDSQGVFMADLITAGTLGQPSVSWERGGEFRSISSSSGLKYFSQRLFWLTEQNSLVVGDSQCNYTSNISFHSNLTSFTVIHPSMHSYPAHIPADKVKVIPDPIKSEDITTQGDWSNFNLTWPRSTEVTHGVVFFKVFVEVGRENKHFITPKHWNEISGLSPYTQLVVSIQPYTYWGYADPTTVSVRSPMSKPTAPLSPEVYVILHKTAAAAPDQSLAADFRWMAPQLTNGIISYHLVTHWIGDQPDAKVTVVKVKGTARHFILAPLVKAQTYNFKVSACTEAGCGPDSVTKTAVTNALNPIPMLLVATKQGLSLMETDSEHNSTIVLTSTPPEAVTFLSQEEPRVFWLDIQNKVYEKSGISSEEVVSLGGTGQDITVDWISRTVYTVESVSPEQNRVMQFNIDTTDYKLLLSRPTRIGSIIADPYNSAILWTEMTSSGQGQVMSANITTGEVHMVLQGARRSNNSRKACSCPQNLNIAPVIAMDYKGHDGTIEIVFADRTTGAIYSSDITGCHCTKIIQPTPWKRLGLPPSLLAVDHLRVSWYNQTEGKLYSVTKAMGDGLVIHDVGDLQDIVAYGSHLQFLPDSRCLEPGKFEFTLEHMQVESTSIRLHLPTPVRSVECQRVSAPRNKYTIYYRKVKVLKTGTTSDDCHAELSLCEKQKSYSSVVELKGLEPYTQYLIQVAISNYYTENLSELMSKPLFLTTKFGVPYAARNVVASPLNPESIIVTWQPPVKYNGPPEHVSYIVQFSTVTAEGHILRETENMINAESSDELIETILKDLAPNHVYSIKVQTCTNRTMCNSTDVIQTKTFMTPSDITFLNTTSHSVQIRWMSPPDNGILSHQIFYAVIKILFLFAVSHPDQPLPPTVSHLKSGAYEVRWEKPADNGAPVTHYMLEYRNVESGTWKEAYNGSIERWLVESSKLKQGKSYIFRVAAVNSEGIGLFSDNSTVFLAAPYAVESSVIDHITIGVIAGIAVLLLSLILAVVLVIRKQYKKKKIQQFIIRGPDTELATLRELPRTAFQTSNTLYAMNIQCTDEEIAKLPHFSRSQLVLTMFLGSGAFGEVFEGLAKNILGDSTGETKCAVKTLRKSALEHEKEEFLKEALLMKNFRHEHILSLLGVCLDNDPQFIIMELMEGGDLLSFLRSCRATTAHPASLLLPDLVKICVHVARGCKYLEDMHFVHRDLAARNCLVSSKSTANMIVKIGDFGLARDIYKNDYYRKEGEGLLPVRWMSPESLVDGFFTTQSDIWAFGVLMWEVVTLGQQPYPARTNIEVLHFVRDRGKLERPDKCADEMYSLMNKCWDFLADHRPSFADLLAELETFQEKCSHMTLAEIAQFSPSVTG